MSVKWFFNGLLGNMATLLTLAASPQLPKSSPFPPPALPGFLRYYEPVRHPVRPGLSLTGVRLGGRHSRHWNCVLRAISHGGHAVATTPAGSWGMMSFYSTSDSVPSRKQPLGRLPHLGLLRHAPAFTHVAACLLAESPPATRCVEGSGDFVTSIAAPIATGWNDSCRAGFTPAEDARLGTGACILALRENDYGQKMVRP